MPGEKEEALPKRLRAIQWKHCDRYRWSDSNLYQECSKLRTPGVENIQYIHRDIPGQKRVGLYRAETWREVLVIRGVDKPGSAGKWRGGKAEALLISQLLKAMSPCLYWIWRRNFILCIEAAEAVESAWGCDGWKVIRDRSIEPVWNMDWTKAVMGIGEITQKQRCSCIAAI